MLATQNDNCVTFKWHLELICAPLQLVEANLGSKFGHGMMWRPLTQPNPLGMLAYEALLTALMVQLRQLGGNKE